MIAELRVSEQDTLIPLRKQLLRQLLGKAWITRCEYMYSYRAWEYVIEADWVPAGKPGDRCPRLRTKFVNDPFNNPVALQLLDEQQNVVHEEWFS